MNKTLFFLFVVGIYFLPLQLAKADDHCSPFGLDLSFVCNLFDGEGKPASVRDPQNAGGDRPDRPTGGRDDEPGGDTGGDGDNGDGDNGNGDDHDHGDDDGDHDKGHGNDDDRHDEDNPGRGKGKGPK